MKYFRTGRLVYITNVPLAVIALVAIAIWQQPQDRTLSSDAQANVGKWRSLRTAPLKRTEVAAARIGRSIYVAGGFDSKTGKSTAAVELYDISSDRWRRAKNMPIALNHPAAVAYGGKLYVIGGYKGARSLTDESAALLRYNPKNNRWQRLKSMPKPRAAHGAAVVGNELYVVGGTRAGRDLRRLYVYSFNKGSWRRGPSMKVARNHVAAASVDGSVYVFGGRNSSTSNLKTVERFDVNTRKWRQLPSMKKERSGIAAVAVGNQIAVFGGEESVGTIKRSEIYNVKRRTWRVLPNMKTPRHGLGGVSFNHRVYSIEGGPEPGFAFSGKLEYLDL